MTDITGSELMTLREACDRLFGGRLSPSALRTEAGKGNLVITQIARKDFVTRRAIEEMISLCSTRPRKPPTTDNGQRPQRQAVTAQEVLRIRLAKAK
ncbi:MAG TPA: hypothetical protein VGX71_27620 [Pseudaminobacter sp.]|nr:hypothetical protein [Pseudaminobacter sp.]